MTWSSIRSLSSYLCSSLHLYAGLFAKEYLFDKFLLAYRGTGFETRLKIASNAVICTEFYHICFSVRWKCRARLTYGTISIFCKTIYFRENRSIFKEVYRDFFHFNLNMSKRKGYNES